MASKRTVDWLVLIFMGTVTCAVLAMAFTATARGLAHAPAGLVYALTAAFGLEYLASAWEAEPRAGL